MPNRSSKRIRERSPPSDPLVGDELAIPEGALLERALLCVVVDVNDPEPRPVARLPFEVVEQRPDVIRLDSDAGVVGPARRLDMLCEEGDTLRIIDVPAVAMVGEGGAVLGDHDAK